jgi:leucyl aminopeptidase
VRLTYRPQSPAGARLGCLVVFLREEDTRAPAHLDLPLREALGRALALKAFGGKAGASFTVLTGSSRLPRLLLVGLGKGADVTREALRRAAGTAAQQLAAMDLTGAGVCFPAGLKAADGAGEALAEGLLLGAYAFEHYKALPSGPPRKRLARIEVFDPARLASAGSVAAGVIRGNAVRLARDLGNQPANAMTPARLADEARALARRRGLKVRVLERSELERLGMGLFLGVAQGSRQPPKLIALEYRAPKAKGTLAFVGKGITFDSGGISIKPAQAMDEMKFDMCGAAAVLGALDAIAQFGPPVNVVGIIPACENLPGGASVKPGDILKSYSGKHVEVLNTDAEGRLILADALAWALKTFRPDAVVDLATLTGACVIALGHYATGAISNNETFQEQVVQAGRRTGEIVWPLPNFPEYGESLKGKYADLQNIGAREGGAITAGLFLRHFVGDVPWVHLDIAGTAWGVKNIGHIPNEGATGVGVRLLADLAAEWTPSSGGGRKARGSAKK